MGIIESVRLRITVSHAQARILHSADSSSHHTVQFLAVQENLIVTVESFLVYSALAQGQPHLLSLTNRH